MITNKRIRGAAACLAVVLLLLASFAGCGKKADPRPSGGAMMELTEDAVTQTFRSIPIDGSAKSLSRRVAIEDEGAGSHEGCIWSRKLLQRNRYELF